MRKRKKRAERDDEGFVNGPGHVVREAGYPSEWLMTTNWVDGPVSY